MLRVAVRLIVTVLVGSAFAIAMVLAYAADFFDRGDARVRNGTTSGSPESLQRINFLDRAT
jgi:hypothetical protein